MKSNLIKLQAPTVKELINALKQLPPNAIVSESNFGYFIGINIKCSNCRWDDDDGDGNPVDYDIAEFNFYSLDD